MNTPVQKKKKTLFFKATNAFQQLVLLFVVNYGINSTNALETRAFQSEWGGVAVVYCKLRIYYETVNADSPFNIYR